MFFGLNILLGPEGQNVAFYSTLLFTVHPVHTEAVSGIVGRAELLCALFMWVSILFYYKSIYTKKTFGSLLSLFACVISVAVAMLCKETGITAIGIAVVYDIVVVNKLFPIDVINFFTSRHSLRDIQSLLQSKQRFLLRCFVLYLSAVILLSIRFSVMGFSAPTFQVVDNPASFMDSIFLRFINYNYIYCLNTWLLLCPEWLCFDWSMGCIPLIFGLDRRILFIVGFWLITGALFLYTFTANKDKYLRYTIVGLALLVIPFIPASNIFFHVGFVIAERTLYMPSVGYCVLIAVGLQKLLLRSSAPKLVLLLYITLILMFFARSWMRSDEWRTEKSLFKSALHVCPLNAKVHYNIAKTAADAGNTTFAKLEYKEALRLNPTYAQAMNNLGNLLKDEGRYEEAEDLFKQAVKLQKNFAAAWMNLGIVLSALKRYNESKNSYLTALTHRPKYSDCYYNLGVLYLEQKDYKNALKAWSNATRLKTTHRRAWTNMILLLDDLGLSEDALKTAHQALQFIPDHAPIYFNMANILGKSGRFLEAEKQFKNAISRNPADPIFYTNLGVLYHRWNKPENAMQMYKKALKINPNLNSARTNLRKLSSLKSSLK